MFYNYNEPGSSLDSTQMDGNRFRSFLDKPSKLYCNKTKKASNFHRYGAGGIVVDADSDRLLIVKGAQKWSLPKGHLDRGEKYHQCAMREIHEETNLNISLDINDRFIDIKKYVYYIIYLYDADQINIKTNDPLEIQDVKWASIKDIKHLNCNRQLEYVVSRWDYIKSIIDKHKEKVTKYPLQCNDIIQYTSNLENNTEHYVFPYIDEYYNQKTIVF